jgi:KDO2-lipid IV(A) lauroyltransferase
MSERIKDPPARAKAKGKPPGDALPKPRGPGAKPAAARDRPSVVPLAKAEGQKPPVLLQPPPARPRRFSSSAIGQRSIAWLMHLLFDICRVTGRRFSARFQSELLREIGPFVREHRVALANLEAAFPEKPPEERAQILSNVWDNLARTTNDYAFLKEIVAAFDPDRPTGGLIEHSGMEHVIGLREGGKPGIVFGAHLGNWELAAAVGRKVGVPITALYRPPANPYIAREIERRRDFVDQLIVSGRGAALQVAAALQAGRNIGVIIDQRLQEGVEIPFFGRPSMSNPIVGILARHFECPVHGARAIRLPGGRFRLEFSAPLDLPRDGKGRIDADASNRLVHGMVEQWVREYPDQWLWLHDRWRM